MRVVTCSGIGDTSATAARLRVKRRHENVLQNKVKERRFKSYSPEHTSNRGERPATSAVLTVLATVGLSD